MVLAFPGCRSLTGDVRYSSPLESARLPADVALSGFGFCHELYGQHGVDEITLCQWAVHERPEPIIHAQKRETIARRHDRNGRRLDGAVVGIIERRGDEALEHDIRFAGALDERGIGRCRALTQQVGHKHQPEQLRPLGCERQIGPAGGR